MVAWYIIAMLAGLAVFGLTYSMLDAPVANATASMTTYGVPAGEVTWYQTYWKDLPIFIVFAVALYGLTEAQKRGYLY